VVLELGEGFLTGIVFVIVYLATNNIVAAVWIAIAMGFFFGSSPCSTIGVAAST
jgi:hypothetical protein